MDERLDRGPGLSRLRAGFPRCDSDNARVAGLGARRCEGVKPLSGEGERTSVPDSVSVGFREGCCLGLPLGRARFPGPKDARVIFYQLTSFKCFWEALKRGQR